MNRETRDGQYARHDTIESNNVMTGNNSSEETGIDLFSRRRFLQGTGVVAAGAALGIGATATSGGDALPDEFRDRRVQEAMQAWNRGFRGQPERAIGQMTTGFDCRHPDMGPWNGIRVRPDDSGGLKLVDENYERLASTREDDPPPGVAPLQFSGEFGPSVGNQRSVYGPFSPIAGADRLEATLIGRVIQHRSALAQYAHYDLRFALEVKEGGEWTVVEEMAQGYGVGENDDTIVAPDGARPPVRVSVGVEVDPDRSYRFVVDTGDDGNVYGTYSCRGQYLTGNPGVAPSDPFADVDPNDLTADTPKIVGWYNEDHYWGPFAKPRHGRTNNRNAYEDGSHFASQMVGTGRGCTVDRETIFTDNPDRVLGPGEKLTYEVEAGPGRAIFASAFGEHLEVAILYQGEIIDEHFFNNGFNGTNSTTEAITVHDTGVETYTIEITPGLDAGSSPRNGVGRVKRVAGGAFERPERAEGDRTDAGRTGEARSMFAGVAPNSSLVGIAGYTETRDRLDELSEDFASTFNLRVLHLVTETHVRPGVAAGELSNIGVFKDVAKAGILTVSPLLAGIAGFKDRAPALADEAIETVPAGPLDGIYFNKGLEGTHPQAAVVDEDGEGVYRKPDVIGPDGNLKDLSATKANSGLPYTPEDEQEPIRKYWNVTGPEGSPFVAGMAGVLAQAMEEEAPDSIALPPPEDAGVDDVMRLKQTILATASETAFTAAPYHGARQNPTYDVGGWDPIEGWGRVNVDAAIDAVTRDLTPAAATSADGTDGGSSTGTTVTETVGLDVPRHSRAVAGYVTGRPGAYEVSVDFSKYNGEDAHLKAGLPHIDLFVYDAENPAEPAGTPNVVAKSQGVTGSTSLRFTAGGSGADASEEGTYYVVAKLVNVPGAVNGFDVQAKFALSVKRTSGGSTTDTVSNG